MRRSLALLLRALLRVDLGDQSLDALVAALGAFFEALDQLGCARRVAARCEARRCLLRLDSKLKNTCARSSRSKGSDVSTDPSWSSTGCETSSPSS